MTALLKDTLGRLARLGSLPTPSRERQTRTEKVAAALAARGGTPGGPSDRDESWEAVAQRIDFADLAAARPRDIRRAINAIWEDGERGAVAAPLVAYSLSEQRKTFDRELLLTYLRNFPWEHPAFETLSEAVGIAAERHNWPWRERGRRFNLWDSEEGPTALGDALLRAEQPLALLREAGLDGDLAAGTFLEETLDEVCEQVGGTKGLQAEDLGRRLVTLFEGLQVGGSDALLAYALLNPWHDRNPSEAHRKAIGGVLVKRIGDPRLSAARWTALTAELPDLDLEALVAILRRWLTETAVRAFFAVVARTTDRPDQWAARQAFWLAYLDINAVSDAWFVLGRDAHAMTGALARETGLSEHGRIAEGGGSQSALLMSIGDLRIAEWSDNGRCRFWRRSDRGAPTLYDQRYPLAVLKAMMGGAGFLTLAHLPSPTGWEPRYAGKVYTETGTRHPAHGSGR